MNQATRGNAAAEAPISSALNSLAAIDAERTRLKFRMTGLH
jgi:hypothetical protein